MKNLLFVISLLGSIIGYSQNKVLQNQEVQKAILALDKDVKFVKVNVLEKGKVLSTMKYNKYSFQIPLNKNFSVRYAEKPLVLKDDKIPNTIKNNTSLGIDKKLSTYYKIPEIMYGKAKNSDEIISYQVYIISKRAFKYNHDDERFLGEVDFVLIDTKDDTSTEDLAQPVHIEIDQGNVDEIQPKSFSLNKLNFPSSNIKLSEENGLDSLQIKIRTASNLSGYPVSLKVEPALRISSLSKNISAFGMEKIKLSIKTVGSSSSDSIKVSFDVTSGKITPQQLTIKNNEIRTVELQSGDKLGKVHIMVNGRDSNSVAYNANILLLNYVFPWMFLGLAMAGGLIGSIIRYRKKIKFGKLVLGMLDGFVVSILYFFLKIPIPKLGDLDYVGVVIFGIGILGGIATVTNIFPYLNSLIVGNGEA